MKPTSRILKNPLSPVAIIVFVLLVTNVAVIPQFVYPSELPSTFSLLVPTLLAAMASVPSILGGGGGFDLSIGPLLGFVNVFLIAVLMPHGLSQVWVALPLCLVLGTAIGAANGAIIMLFRLQPIVVTLGTYLFLAGEALVILPVAGGTAPGWATWFSAGWNGLPHSALLLVAALVIWIVLKHCGYVRLLQAVGGDDRAAFTTGVNVAGVRILAYALGGLFAALAGIAVTALVGSGDGTVGPQYTLVAIASVAVGGNALAGGFGTMIGPALGALVVFLIQNLLAASRVSSSWTEVAYGTILLVAVAANSQIRRALFRSSSEAPQ